MHGIDPATEVPPLTLLPARKHRPTPHIYTDAQVAAMMDAAGTLLPPLRAATMETLIGLMACTGIRDSEAFALDRTDIDRDNRLPRIHDSKYGKSREVLIHDTTIATLDAYIARRDELRAGGDRTCVLGQLDLAAFAIRGPQDHAIRPHALEPVLCGPPSRPRRTLRPPIRARVRQGTRSSLRGRRRRCRCAPGAGRS
jgi:integrase